MKQKNIYVIGIFVAILIFIYVFPRWVISSFGAGNPWASYLYQYGLGAVVFFVGIAIILKSKSCQLEVRKQRRWFYFLIGGFFYFAFVHWIWIYLALNTATITAGGN